MWTLVRNELVVASSLIYSHRIHVCHIC
jgi:hypothetical protein